MAPLPDRDAMAREHGAWMDFCKELRGVFAVLEASDLPADDAQQIVALDSEQTVPMFRALRKWGEELVNLRYGQEAQVIQRARDEAREAYEGQYERGTYPSEGSGR